MRLLIPHAGCMEPADVRLLRLAEFLGISCDGVALQGSAQESLGSLGDRASEGNCCLVVNPTVLRKWTGGHLPSGLGAFLRSHFPHLLLYNCQANAFDAFLISELSSGRFSGIEGIARSGLYSVSASSRDVCESFAGLNFGPANPENDRVFRPAPTTSGVRSLISIGDKPLMATIRHEGGEALFLGSTDVLDIESETDGTLDSYFSRFLPFAMALRYAFGDESWKPGEGHASVIVDDPLLRKNYGFLNYNALLAMMEKCNFHTTIAFIPYNYRRTSPEIARMFKENTDRFSLCVHGNDHTGAEFATVDKALLRSMLELADQRMRVHCERTGIRWERVMVFPQGKFSVEAMRVLQSMSFDCAVNTGPYPRKATTRLTAGELAQPALVRYSGFPLFVRSRSCAIRSQDIAFNLFFGKPVLLVEHHDAFKNSDTLLGAISRINAVAPDIRWTNVGEATSGSFWRRRLGTSEHQIRAYCGTVRIANQDDVPARYAVEWSRVSDGTTVKSVLCDRASSVSFDADERRVKVSVELAPRTYRRLSLLYANNTIGLPTRGLRRTIRVFARRRLSEIRDNYISKNQRALAFAKTLQRSLSRKRSD